MTKLVRYRCKNCGKRFEIEILEEHEVRQRQRDNQPIFKIKCPDCSRTDVRKGWE